MSSSTDGLSVSKKAQTGRSKHRLWLKLLLLLVVLGAAIGVAVSGWGYLRFRAIPRLAIPKSALSQEADLSTPVVEWNPSAPGAVSVDSSIVSSPPASVTTTSAASVVPTSTKEPTATKPRSPGAAGVSTTLPDVGNCEDATQVAGDRTKCPSALIKFKAVAPGPIVDVRSASPFGGSNAKNILIVGTDSRSAVPLGQEIGFGVGQVSGTRTDTIFVLREDPDSKQAWILSIPRDLYLPFASTGIPARINAAYEKSPEELTRTISQRLNIPIAHLAEIDFSGFQKIVETVGGVEVCFAYPTRDVLSGLNRPNPGCQTLNPQAATAYVRARHYEEFVNGSWQRDPTSDLGRIKRQQAFVRSVLKSALAKGNNPLVANSMLDDVEKAVKIDSTFTFPETAKLAQDLRSFDPNSLKSFTVPVVPVRIQGADVLTLNPATAGAVIGQFR